MKKSRLFVFVLFSMCLLSMFATSCVNSEKEETTKMSSEKKEKESKKKKKKKTKEKGIEKEKPIKVKETEKETETTKEVPEIDKKTALYKDLDYENKWYLIWGKPNTQINDLGDLYELKDVCIAQSVGYEYTPEMFENVQIGDILHLPNGEFVLTDLEENDYGQGKTKHLFASNGYFSQQFEIQSNRVIAYGIGEYVQQETVFIGDVYVAKDAKYDEFLEENPGETVEMGFKEGVVEREGLANNGFFLSIQDMDEKGIIHHVDLPFIP